MKIAEILLVESQDVQSAVVDLLVTMAGEELDSVSLDTLVGELSAQGVDADTNSLFDLLDSLPIVRNIKDGVVYFNTDSDSSHRSELPDQKKQQSQVSDLASKQVDKNLGLAK